MNAVERPNGAHSDLAQIDPIILHVGVNSTLLAIRNDVLARTGYSVLSAGNLDDVDALLLDTRRGLVVLCHSLSLEQRAKVLQKLKKQSGFVGLLVAKNSTVLSSDGLPTIHTHQGPHALVSLVTELLSA